MHRHPLGAIALAWLATAAAPARAQTPPPPPPTAPSQNLFQATPQTYAPRYDGAATPDRQSSTGAPRPGMSLGYDPRVLLDDVLPVPPRPATPLGAASASRPSVTEGRAAEPSTPAAVRSEPPSLPLASPPPGVPKTFYVVPGCYAGDVPPRSDQLSRGCRAVGVRVIPHEPRGGPGTPGPG